MRIAVIGPQGTGKSTFIQDFLQSFPDYVSPEENYRDIIAAEGLPTNQLTTEESQRRIRDFLFEQQAGNIEENVIFDRSLIDNYVYTKAQVERGIIDPAFLAETADIMFQSLEYLDALIFIPTAASVPLVEDEIRDTDPLFVDAVNRIFFDTLIEIARETALPVVTVTGEREERVLEAERRLFAGSFA